MIADIISNLAEHVEVVGNIQNKTELQVKITKALTPIKAIRKMCLKCMGGSYKGVRECKVTDCPLSSYRMGRNPRRKGIGGNTARVNQNSRLNSRVLIQDKR